MSEKAFYFLSQAVDELYPDINPSPILWNDHRAQSVDQVIEVLDRAIKHAEIEKEENG